MSLWLSGTVHFALGCFLAAMAIAMFRLFAGPVRRVSSAPPVEDEGQGG